MQKGVTHTKVFRLEKPAQSVFSLGLNAFIVLFFQKGRKGPLEQGQLHATSFLALSWILKSAAQHELVGVPNSAGRACAIMKDPARHY